MHVLCLLPVKVNGRHRYVFSPGPLKYTDERDMLSLEPTNYSLLYQVF
jgi:hypothetical protein